MQKLKQGMAAVGLIATMGLAIPSTLGGAALADISPHNPHRVKATFNCDLDGNGSYEKAYDLVSTESSTMWQDTQSKTVLVQRLKIDVLYSDYTVYRDPTHTAVDFHDATADWWFTPQDYTQGTGAGQGNSTSNGKGQGKGKPPGLKTVRCTETNTYHYAPYESDVALNDAFDLKFVQNTDHDTTPGACPEDSDSIDGAREDYIDPTTGTYACVTYSETDTTLYDVTISGLQAGAKSAHHRGSHHHHRRHRH